MKKMSFLFLFSLVTMLSFAVDVTGRMRITVVDGITVTENQQLNFGSVDASGVAGTVRVTYDGVRTTTGGVTAVGTGANAGYFSITGIVGTAVSYTVPTTAITILGQNTGDALIVENFIANLTTNTTNGTGVLKIGATANLAENQAVDSYSGTYDITVVNN